MKFGMLFYLGVLGFCVILLPFIWFALNSMFLCAWGMALWTLRDSTSAASINMQQMNPSANLTNINLTQPIAASNMVCPSGQL